MKSLGNGTAHLEEKLPTWQGAVVFRMKATCFQLRRWLLDQRQRPARYTPSVRIEAAVCRGEWRADLWHESAAPQERLLQLGKVQNLRVAARSLHGIEVPAGEVLSFWRQIGRATRLRGYTVGRELREGCLIPNVGGGLCLLSGAIYNAALAAGLEVVERHAHSNPGVGPLARVGRDATVFWNYVDLRLRAPFPWRLEVRLTSEHLIVRVLAVEQAAESGAPSPPLLAQGAGATHLNSCATCGINSCFRHSENDGTAVGEEHTAVLVDDWQPEWGALVKREEYAGAFLCRPMDGERFRKANYQWSDAGFSRVRSATVLTLRRGRAMRRLREQGAARQQALLVWDEKLARAYARRLRATHTHLLIAQNLLPFLWREGVLGGRTFDVLMSRLPLDSLHAALKQAATMHPESTTCSDFQAPQELVATEAEALAAADRWITPHSVIAQLAGSRAALTPWHLPAARIAQRGDGCRVVFPASTLCRKGAYEVREAARRLGLEVVCLGGFLEGADFWSGVCLVQPDPHHWLNGIDAVVLPAFVEHHPRRLLEAVASGVPVIASTACGLASIPGVTEIRAGDVADLVQGLREVLPQPAAAMSH